MKLDSARAWRALAGASVWFRCPNISSVAGRFAAATTERYNATKFGVTAFTEALRQEYAQNITCVCPSSSQAGWTPSC
ncbi:hypothetical protein BST13_12800 [Mycobacterium aquaticum]|uniref:Uncharacterized protein n=1 Tax=Mycobacterium aquaticum TaxID=1927124 RepID=A0A1X0B0M9_9MYCO|nr:hypothetical protein BST13_12800 [Mycobacterium aquaticum]